MGSHFDIGYFKKPVKVRAKVAKERTVINKMYAWQLDKEYYDGNRLNGYGGFKYDGRWKKLLPKIIKKYRLTKKSKVLDLGCKKGFLLKDLNILIPGRITSAPLQTYFMAPRSTSIFGKFSNVSF